MKIYSYLGDKTKYNVLLNSTETVNGMKCHVINIIPNGEGDFILGKLWLSQTNNCPYKVELTTRRGTVKMENYFKTMLTYGLPDKVIFYLENFKAPKGKGLGPKKETKEVSTTKYTGKIMLYERQMLDAYFNQNTTAVPVAPVANIPKQDLINSYEDDDLPF